MKQRQRDQNRRTMQRLRVHRFDAVREVACEQCEVAYGAVAVATGRRITVEVLQPDGTIQIQRHRRLLLSYEMRDYQRSPAPFLKADLIRHLRQQGTGERLVQRQQLFKTIAK